MTCNIEKNNQQYYWYFLRNKLPKFDSTTILLGTVFCKSCIISDSTALETFESSLLLEQSCKDPRVFPVPRRLLLVDVVLSFLTSTTAAVVFLRPLRRGLVITDISWGSTGCHVSSKGALGSLRKSSVVFRFLGLKFSSSSIEFSFGNSFSGEGSGLGGWSRWSSCNFENKYDIGTRKHIVAECKNF